MLGEVGAEPSLEQLRVAVRVVGAQLFKGALIARRGGLGPHVVLAVAHVGVPRSAAPQFDQPAVAAVVQAACEPFSRQNSM